MTEYAYLIDATGGGFVEQKGSRYKIRSDDDLDKLAADVQCIRKTSDNVKITKIDSTNYAVEIPVTEFEI